MESKTVWMIAVAAMLMLVCCTPKTPTDLTRVSFIPLPASVTAGGDGGLYTQEQYAGIIDYALRRHITIIPGQGRYSRADRVFYARQVLSPPAE